MTNVPFADIGQFDDIEARNAWRDEVATGRVPAETFLWHMNRTGRDHARTPMQWDGGASVRDCGQRSRFHSPLGYRTRSRACASGRLHAAAHRGPKRENRSIRVRARGRVRVPIGPSPAPRQRPAGGGPLDCRSTRLLGT
jgi:hypothetical protein